MRQSPQWCAFILAAVVSQATAVEVVPVHPGAGEFVTSDEFLVAAAVNGEMPESALVVFRLDGRRIAAGVALSDGVCTWVPDPGMLVEGRLAGKRSVEMVLLGPDSTELARAAWSFTLLKSREEQAADQQRPLQHSGRVFGVAGQYSLDGDTRWECAAGGTYRASFGRLRYGAEVYLTNLNESNTQDRNVYRADVSYGRWLSLKVGDTRPRFHEAILSGKRVRGLEFSARGILPSGIDIANLDVSWGQALRDAKPDTYARTIFAGRLSFGSGKRFQFGLTFLKGWDDTASIHPPYDTLITIDSVSTVPDTAWDTSLVQGATPEENAVLGADVVGRFWDGRIKLYASYAFSARTRDISDSAITKADLDSAFGVSTIDPSSLDWLITLNQSSLPLSGGTGVLNSSYIAAGIALRLPFAVLTDELEASWKLQGANYYSMGSALLGTGEQGFVVQNRLLLLDSRLLFDCGYGRAWNNMDDLQNDPTTTNRFSARASLFYSQRIPSVSVGYTYTSAANEDTTYGFGSSVSGLNVVSAYGYHLGRLNGNLQVYANWTGIGNEWRPVTFDTAAVSDTSSFLSTGIYGVHVLARIEDAPVEFSGGLNTNAGSEQLLRLINGSVDGRYRVLPGLLSLNLGLRIGASRMPPASSYDFHIRIPYGAELTWRRHLLRYAGYVTAEGADVDAVNTLRYEWRF